MNQTGYRPGLFLALLPFAFAAWTWAASATFLLGSGLSQHYPVPTWQWWTYLPYAGANPVVGGWLKLAAGAAAVPVLLLLWSIMVLFKREVPLHGESHFATGREARKSGLRFRWWPDGESIILGRTRGLLFGWLRRLICLPGDEHVVLYARTGSGKGVSFAIPNCLAWRGSLVALDVKGELYRKTAWFRRWFLGHKTYFFNPAADDKRTHCWNPLSLVPRDGEGTIDAIQRVMFGLIPPTEANDPYWQNAARRVAVGIAALRAETPGEELTIAGILSDIGRPDYAAHLRAKIEAARVGGRPYLANAVGIVLGWLDRRDEKGADSVLDTIRTSLSLWDNEVVAAATSRSDFDIADLRSKRVSIYIGAPVTEHERLAPLIALLFQQIVALNTKVEYKQDPSHKHRCLLMLDEGWVLKIKQIAESSNFIRSYGLRIALVVQTTKQLEMNFGEKGADNLIENTGAEIAFGIKGMKLAKDLSEASGTNTVEEVTRSAPRYGSWFKDDKHTEQTSKRRRALLLPQEVQRLPPLQQLVIRAGMPMLRCYRVRWYRDPSFFRRRRKAALPDPIQVNIVRDSRPIMRGPSPEEILRRKEDAERAQREAEAAEAVETAETLEAQAQDAEVAREQADTVARDLAAEAARLKVTATAAKQTAQRARKAAADAAERAKKRTATEQMKADAAASAKAAEEATRTEAKAAADAAEASERARAAKSAASRAATAADKARKRANAAAAAARQFHQEDEEAVE